MMMKFATCCWLLITLGGGTALAQTHPQQKRSRRPVVVRRQVPTRVSVSRVEQPSFVELKDYPHGNFEAVESVPFDSNRVYTYAEQMPTLNGQPAATASIATISQYLVVPPAAPDGRVFVGFEVTKAGSVRNVRILKGMRADLDSAVVKAARQLPRFTPGKQSGHAVAVSIVLPVTIPVRQQP